MFSIFTTFTTSSTKYIFNQYKNFDYNHYQDKTKSDSIDPQIKKTFLEKNKNFDQTFEKKNNRLHFLSYLLLTIAIICIVGIAIIGYLVHSHFTYYWLYILLAILVICPVVLVALFTIPIPKIKTLKNIKLSISDLPGNIKLFNQLYEEGIFVNFTNQTGPNEFRIALMLKDHVKFTLFQDQLNSLRMQNIRPNEMATIYATTKMLLTYFQS